MPEKKFKNKLICIIIFDWVTIKTGIVLDDIVLIPISGD